GPPFLLSTPYRQDFLASLPSQAPLVRRLPPHQTVESFSRVAHVRVQNSDSCRSHAALDSSGRKGRLFVRGHEGLIRIKGKLWRATSNQEIPYGQNVHVVGNDGLNLRVEVGPIIKSQEELLDKEIAEGIERRLQREDSSKF